jgi:flavin reductase (DIM6/NTAB) family NADH-FMN oxidoreductase RutF
MRIIASEQTKDENYQLLIGSVVPRPIAFITTKSQSGVVNGAPFSFFNVVGTEPPLLMFSCLRKPGGMMKDTARNILATKEFVIHVVDEENVEKINYTAIDAPEEVSEIELADLTLLPGDFVQVPRVAESKISMECRLHQHITIGESDGAPNTDLIIGEIICFHIDDQLYQEGSILTPLLKPVGRLAGHDYVSLGRVFDMDRPVYHREIEKRMRS